MALEGFKFPQDALSCLIAENAFLSKRAFHTFTDTVASSVGSASVAISPSLIRSVGESTFQWGLPGILSQYSARVLREYSVRCPWQIVRWKVQRITANVLPWFFSAIAPES